MRYTTVLIVYLPVIAIALYLCLSNGVGVAATAGLFLGGVLERIALVDLDFHGAICDHRKQLPGHLGQLILGDDPSFLAKNAIQVNGPIDIADSVLGKQNRLYGTAFQEVDLLIGPTTPTTAYPLGDKVDDPLAMYLGDLYTAGANLAGLGGISVPCGMASNGLPIGLQLQAPPLAEERLLRAAHQYQTATDWHTRRPQL